MASDSVEQLQCPVCRARQASQDACRRCGADLRLLLKTLAWVLIWEDHFRASLARGDVRAAKQAWTQLQWLDPQRTRALQSGDAESP